MASRPSSSSNTTYSIGSYAESSTTTYGSIAEDAGVDYANGQLSWGRGTYSIKDEDVIVVTTREGGYTIWSLASTIPASESEPKPAAPFELRTTPTTNLPNE